MGAVTDPLIRDEGVSDAVWLPWLAHKCPRGVSMSDLVAHTQRLVVVAPHPDDEVLACGGLLAHRSRQGLESIVVAVTDGDASHGHEDPSARAALAGRRTEESLAGLRALGLPASCVTRLGIPDGEVAGSVDKVARQLRVILNPLDVVVTTWSGDGHPDHEATAQAARRACAEAQCRLAQAPVWMWHWACPGDPRVPWNAMVAFDLSDADLEAKKYALDHHASQLEDRGEAVGPVLIPSILERARRRQEFFFV